MASPESLTVTQLCHAVDSMLQLWYSHTSDDMGWLFNDHDLHRAHLIVSLFIDRLIEPTPQGHELIIKLYRETEKKRAEFISKAGGIAKENT